jgi:hypothetical protein
MEQRPAVYLSTPMIKGELLTLLGELHPAKRWPKKVRLRDLCSYALCEFRDGSADPRVTRVLDLARVIDRHERR